VAVFPSLPGRRGGKRNVKSLKKKGKRKHPINVKDKEFLALYDRRGNYSTFNSQDREDRGKTQLREDVYVN